MALVTHLFVYDPATAESPLVYSLLVPFVLDRPVLLAALLGHLVAVTAATRLSMGLLELEARRAEEGELTPT